MFSTGVGPLAPTAAPPSERLPILRELQEIPGSEARRVLLKTAESALSAGPASRMIGAEITGLHVEQGWTPRTWGEARAELSNYQRSVWSLVCDVMRSDGDAATRLETAETLLKVAGGLLETPLEQEVLDELRAMADDPLLPDRPVVEAITRMLHSDLEQDGAAAAGLREILDTYESGTLDRRLRRYVGAANWDEMHGDEDLTRYSEAVARLASDAVAAPDELRSSLPWLSTAEAERGFMLGQKLAGADADKRLLPDLLDALRKAGEDGSAAVLGGYLHRVVSANPEEREDVLGRMADDDALARFVPEAAWRSGYSERSVRLVTDVVRSGRAEVQTFGHWRAGGDLTEFPTELAGEWVELLAAQGDARLLAFAFDLAACFWLWQKGRRSLAPTLLESLLTHRLVLTPADPDRGLSGSVEWRWAKVFEQLAAEDPPAAGRVFRGVLSHAAGCRGLLHSRAVNEVFTAFIREEPHDAWAAVAAQLELGDPVNQFLVTRWLSGDHVDEGRRGFLPLFPEDSIWEWIDQQPDERAAMIAEATPPTLDPQQGGSLTRELLVRYGNQDRVRSAVGNSMLSGTFWGPEAKRHAEQRVTVEAWRAGETEPNVLRWVDEMSQRLRAMEDEAAVREERRW